MTSFNWYNGTISVREEKDSMVLSTDSASEIVSKGSSSIFAFASDHSSASLVENAPAIFPSVSTEYAASINLDKVVARAWV